MSAHLTASTINPGSTVGAYSDIGVMRSSITDMTVAIVFGDVNAVWIRLV